MQDVASVNDTTSLGLTNFGSGAQFGEFASAAFVENCGVGSYYNVTGEDVNCINLDCDVVFDGVDFGEFNQFSGGLLLQGGEVKSWKIADGNVCSASICYAVYPLGDTPDVSDFNCINLPFQSNCCGTEFCDGFGPCTGNDQKWYEQTAGIDLTANPIGNYVLEVYFEYSGSDSDPGGCDIVRRIEKAGGEGFVATFEIVENGAATICTLLPVDLVAFDAFVDQEKVQLQWQTASEYRNDRFEVQRSFDGENFEFVGAVEGFGFSSTPLDYAFTDEAPPAGRQLFYRLRQVDTDGMYTYSHLVTATIELALQVQVQPNPTTEVWNIQLFGVSNGHLCLRDLRGNLLFETTVGAETVRLPVHRYAPGVYLLEVSAGDEKRVTRLMRR